MNTNKPATTPKKYLLEMEQAWLAVFKTLVAGNPAAFNNPGSCAENAVREIKRLQANQTPTKGA